MPIGAVGTLIDLGAGNCAKAGSLFDALQPQRYVAVDISVDFLRDALDRLAREHPQHRDGRPRRRLQRVADAARRAGSSGRPLFFYPGSSIGNFTPAEARRLPAPDCAPQAGGGGLLIGVDLVKPATILEPAYDDALGVTAAFNLNLLLHLNRLVGTDFRPREWRHVGIYNAEQSRIEMHLEARIPLRVGWPGGCAPISPPASASTPKVHTNTRSTASAACCARPASADGRHWTDDGQRFAVFWAPA